MDYKDFTLCARDWHDGRSRIEVTSSPVGRMSEPEDVRYDWSVLQHSLDRLERGRISLKALSSLGSDLAGLILPPQARGMLFQSLATIGPEHGLRLRLVINDPQVAALPWEYLYVPHTAKDQGLESFLVLDPRISLVRHQALQIAHGTARADRPFKMVVGLSSPSDAPPLALETEQDVIEQALCGISDIEVTFVPHLTVEKLVSACQGVHIFDFVGHGTSGGQGILLENSAGRAEPFPAGKLALILRNAGVRVAVLGACETGRRNGSDAWNDTPSALMRAGIAAAILMQYEITDSSGISFGKHFYRALVAGLSLDEAVTAGRLAILSQGHGDETGWGVPVLYMRADDGIVFPEATAHPSLHEARVQIRQQVQDLQGKLLGAEVTTMTSGSLSVNQDIGTIGPNGEATGIRIDHLGDS